jgi:hypothetical protein
MVGTHVNRNITWADEAAPFMTYLARSSYMLQRGKPAADLLYLLNEGAPSTMPFWGAGLEPAPPRGYDYDYANADALLTRVSVSGDGSLVLADGVRYRVLVLPPTDRMTLPVLRKIAELVRGGATVVGARPAASPSLVGGAAADSAHAALVADVWGDLDGTSRTRRSYGRGVVVWGEQLARVLGDAGIVPDVEYAAPLGDSLVWIHRRLGDGDVYYVASFADTATDVDVRFRVAGKASELWRAETGAMEPASYHADSARTTVRLHLAAHDALFVVFRRPAAERVREVPVPSRRPLAALGGPWTVRFPPGLGAPASITLPALASWTANADSGVRYFSGTATYERTVRAPASWFAPGRRLVLSLGDVRDLAQVVVNGTALPVVWTAPFEVDVTRALHAGTNRVEIRVTNEWTNRLIGDRATTPEHRVLAPGAPAPFGPPPPLSESGLLGPVIIDSIMLP